MRRDTRIAAAAGALTGVVLTLTASVLELGVAGIYAGATVLLPATMLAWAWLERRADNRPGRDTPA